LELSPFTRTILISLNIPVSYLLMMRETQSFAGHSEEIRQSSAVCNHQSIERIKLRVISFSPLAVS